MSRTRLRSVSSPCPSTMALTASGAASTSGVAGVFFAGKNGANLDRLAVFPPSAVNDAGLTTWTYWDITAKMLPGLKAFLDFPDLAFGSKYLYLTQDGGLGGKVSQTRIRRRRGSA